MSMLQLAALIREYKPVDVYVSRMTNEMTLIDHVQMRAIFKTDEEADECRAACDRLLQHGSMQKAAASGQVKEKPIKWDALFN